MNDRPLIRAAIDAAVAAGGAAVTILVPDQAVSIAAASEFVKHAGNGVLDRLTRHRDEVTDTVLDEATSVANLGLPELLAELVADDRKLLAFGSALEAAWKTAMEEKVRALGRSLGNLATDEAKIDPETLWIDIISKVDRSHLRVLLSIRATTQDLPIGQPKVTVERIQTSTGLGALVYPLLETLSSLGLAEESTEGGGMSFGPDRRFGNGLRLGPLADEFFIRLGVEPGAPIQHSRGV